MADYTLKTSKGPIELRLTKRVFYEFDKAHGAFLGRLVTINPDGSVRPNVGELTNIAFQVDLAALAQIGPTKLSSEELLEVADSHDLLAFLSRAVEVYLAQQGLEKPGGN